jgi:hypothetical protein
MFARPKIRSTDGRWFEWEVLKDNVPTAACPLCGGILSQKKPNGILVVPTYPILGGYLVKDRFVDLTDDLWFCRNCLTTFKLKDIGRQVVSCAAPDDE